MNSTNNQLISFQEVLAKLMRFCSYQERSEWEVRQKATSYNLTEAEVDQLIQLLKDDNFIDELRFATVFVRGKVKVKKWGIYKIKQGLAAKGVKSNIVSEAIKTIDMDVYLANLDYLFETKNASLGNSKSDQAKLYRYLLSKGYESEYIFSRINRKD